MQRIKSLDLLRGVIMVLMAIDHVRLYGGIPAGGSTPDLFFTRWITHFCAPGFAFFAGTSIYFLSQKLNNTTKLAGYLVKRGLLLVLLEITLLRFFWAFHIDYSQFFLAGVIWMLGWCLVLMALLVRFKPVTIILSGAVIILAQQAFHYVPQLFPQNIQPAVGRFWNFIYPTGIEMPENIAILYVIVPWIGVMALGYGFGKILKMDPVKRDKLCIRIGLSGIIVFLLAGIILLLKKPAEENELPFVLRLLNQNKYPPSQLFLLMTLSPLVLFVPLAERAKGWLANVFILFGKVPMFYYIMHIPVIHLTALLVNLLRAGEAHQDWYMIAPFGTTQPEGIRWPLYLLYVVWVCDLVLLFYLCKWYASIKAKHFVGFLRYL